MKCLLSKLAFVMRRRRLGIAGVNISFARSQNTRSRDQSGNRATIPGRIWRSRGDSNPRYVFTTYNGLANRRLQPLGHSSAGRLSCLRSHVLSSVSGRKPPKACFSQNFEAIAATADILPAFPHRRSIVTTELSLGLASPRHVNRGAARSEKPA